MAALFEKSNKELQNSYLREAREKERPSKRKTNLKATLDAVVMKDRDRFASWLECLGYWHYHKARSQMSWDEWCEWFAPTDYEMDPFRKKVWVGPRMQRHGPNLRPEVTLKQAKDGYEAWVANNGEANLRDLGLNTS